MGRALAIVAMAAASLFLGGCGTGPAEPASAPSVAVASGSAVHGTSGTQVWYADVTASSGIQFEHSHSHGGDTVYLPETMGAGCAIVDYDGDGHLDVFLVQGRGPDPRLPVEKGPGCRLYKGRGDFTFQDVTEGAGLGSLRGALMGCAWFDGDNDGRPDLAVSGHETPTRLLHQKTDHTFEDRTVESGLAAGGTTWNTGITPLDFDGDGLLDLYLGAYLDFRAKDCVPNPALVTITSAGLNQPSTLSPFSYGPLPKRLMRNRGNLSFEDVTQRAGVANPDGKTLSALAADLDGDGWTDLFVANDVTAKALFINQRDGTFKEMARLAWVGDVHGSMGLAVGDVDASGAPDLFCTHWINEPNALYRSNLRRPGPTAGPGDVAAHRRLTFTECAQPAGLADPSIPNVGWGCAMVDVDRDGHQDIVVVNGHTFLDQAPAQETGARRRLVPQPGMLFLSRGNGTFTQADLDPADALGRLRVGRGLAVGDLDEDGWPDLVITANNGAATLLKSVAPRGNHGLSVTLVGTRANRDAVGSSIRLVAGGREQFRYRATGESYLSSSAPQLHFGLGRATEVKDLVVTWPLGARESFPVHGVDRNIVLTEGTGRPVK